MNVEPNNYDKVLELFVSDDELRPKMTQPCKRGDFVFATDGYAVVKMPIGKPALDYTQDHDFYDVQKFFLVEQNKSEKIDFEPIERWFSTVPKSPIYDDCETCDGEAEIYCQHCKHSHECDDCNGTGHGKKIGEQAGPFEQFELDGVGFSYKNLYRLFLLQKQENVDAVWVFRDAVSPNLFKVGEIEIVLCPRIKH